MPMAISFVGASIIWRFVYDAPPGGPRPDRPAQPDRRLVRRAARAAGCRTRRWNTLLPHRRADLDRRPDSPWSCSPRPSRAFRPSSSRRRSSTAPTAGSASRNVTRSRHPRLAHRRADDDLDRLAQGLRHRAHHDGRRQRHQRHRQRDVHASSRTSSTGRSAAFAVVLFLLVLPIVIYNARQIRKQREIR